MEYRKADNDHPYGHGKYETIASLIISLLLFIIGLYLIYGGVITIIHSTKDQPLPSWCTIIIAIVSIISKEFCYRYTIAVGNKINSNVLKANAWHHRSDAFSSIATLIGVSTALIFGAKWAILDLICAILISLLIIVSMIVSAYKITLPSLNELLETGIPEDERFLILDIIKSESGVKRVHNLRSRRNGHAVIIDVNIHVDPDITVRAVHGIATNLEKSIRNKYTDDCIIYVHVKPEN